MGEKLNRKKIQTDFIRNINNKLILAWYLREAPVILEIRMFLYYKNKTRRDIFEEKGRSKQFL